jgi:Virulence activator alpha C-term
LVKLFALEIADPDRIRTAVSERLEQARGKLAIYERLRDQRLDGRSEVPVAAASHQDRLGMRDAGRLGDLERRRVSEAARSERPESS